MNSKKNIEILTITYTANGEVNIGKKIAYEKRIELGLADSCNCGDEQCVGGWVYRCMAGGGGGCVWYETHEVC